MLLLKLLLFPCFSLLSCALPSNHNHELTIRADAPNQPPAIPPNENDCYFQYYKQRIDHFGQHDGTFQQKYNLVTDFYKPGGPIFFYQGEESTYLDCVDTSIGYSWAQQTNGMAVILEHRYFGKSAPLNATDPTTQSQKFEFLTLDNVMADAAGFLGYLKKNITGALESKVIVYSGSYGGFLATAFRQNRPNDFYGAIASAPPVEALGNNTKADGFYNWYTYVSNLYQDQSAEASSNIKNAITTLQRRVTSGTNLTSLKSELGLCNAPTKDEFSLVYGLYQTVLSSAAELNYPIARPGRSPVAFPLDVVVNISLTQQDPIQVINETIWLWYGPANFSCIDHRTSAAPLAIVPAIQQGIFGYLTCKYFPLWAQADVPKGTIFVPSSPGVLETAICDKTYNISTPSAATLRKKYKYTPEDLRNSTRIIWSLAQFDPTSAVSPNQPGINAPAMSADRNVSRVLYTSNMAHREDLFAPDPSDGDAVIQARRIELESIKGWLGWYGL